MKNIIVIFLSVSSMSVCGAERSSRLTVVNNHSKKIVIRYEPQMNDQSALIPLSIGSSIIPMPPITTVHAEVTIESQKQAQLKQLLAPYITIKIDGFKPLENLSIVQSHIPLVINSECNNQIKVIQGSFERGIMDSLQLSIQASTKKRKEKESSDEDGCGLQ
jgi:hypothetical protein